MSIPDRAREADVVQTIPILDLAPYFSGEAGALEATAEQLRFACEHVGFYYITNHGVPRELVDRVFAEAERFHALPLEVKLALKANRHNIGYMPYKSSVFRASRFYDGEAPDLNAAFFLRRDLPADHADVLAGRRFRGRNQWPDHLPGFRETLVAYLAQMEALASRLIPLYAAALGLPPDYFSEAFTDPMYILRLTHYPAGQVHIPDQYGIAPHSDSSFMTLLAQNKVPGLSICLPSGRWIDAPVIPGTFVVNSGDNLHRWTNERFLSTPHRAINASGVERYAIPFFFDCNLDHVMDCLPTCQSPDNPPRYPPTTFAEYAEAYGKQYYDHMRDDG